MNSYSDIFQSAPSFIMLRKILGIPTNILFQRSDIATTEKNFKRKNTFRNNENLDGKGKENVNTLNTAESITKSIGYYVRGSITTKMS